MFREHHPLLFLAGPLVSGSLLVCRGAVGAALGGLLPASFAIVGDMYPADERPHAIAMMAVAGQHLAAQDLFDTAQRVRALNGQN